MHKRIGLSSVFVVGAMASLASFGCSDLADCPAGSLSDGTRCVELDALPGGDASVMDAGMDAGATCQEDCGSCTERECTDLERFREFEAAVCDNYLSQTRPARDDYASVTYLRWCVDAGKDLLMKRWLAAIEAGDVTIDAAAFRACLESEDGPIVVPPAPLSYDVALEHPCRRMFVGTAIPGSSCASGDECNEGYCSRPGGWLTCGVCEELGGAGADCIVDLQCQAGLRCTGPAAGVCSPARIGDACARFGCVDEGAVCVAGRCAVPERGDACQADDSCGPELYCEVNEEVDVENGRCADRLSDGAACGFQEQCLGGKCIAGTCERDTGIGSRCEGTVHCDDGLRCDQGGLEGHCVELPGEGEACAVLCEDGLRCLESLCQPEVVVVGEGEDCANPEECDQGFGCDGVCKRIVAPGQACGGTSENLCGPAAQCEEGLCAVLPDLGSSCSERCIRGECREGVCQNRPVGAPCGTEDAWESADECGDRGQCVSDTATASSLCALAVGLGEACSGFGDAATDVVCEDGLCVEGVCQMLCLGD